MRSNEEIRGLAWGRLWQGGWFWRLFGATLLLGVCGQAVQSVVRAILGRLYVDDWRAFLESVERNRMDMTTPIPNLTRDYIINASTATCLEMFLGVILSGIAAYGVAVVTLKCLDENEQGWLADAFGGFRRPFGMAWMLIRLTFVYIGWGLAGAILLGAVAWQVLAWAGISLPPTNVADASAWPTSLTQMDPHLMLTLGSLMLTLLLVEMLILCVPFYRYRYLWLVRADCPDASAGECFRRCRALMKGNVMRAVRLDCSYWRLFALMLLGGLLLGTLAAVGAAYRGNLAMLALVALAAISVLLAYVGLSIVCVQYVGVGHGFLYRELRRECEERNGASCC